VLPALIRKAHDAKQRGDNEIVVWGTGSPRREFLYVDDLADACVMLMEMGYDGPLLNVGVGGDITIKELAETIVRVIGYKGTIIFDAEKPDGTPRKLLDVSGLNALGFTARVGLEEGVALAYADYLARHVKETR
jgi:GDP-L-fucose synthase